MKTQTRDQNHRRQGWYGRHRMGTPCAPFWPTHSIGDLRLLSLVPGCRQGGIDRSGSPWSATCLLSQQLVCVCLCASVKFAQTGAMRGLSECCEGMERGKGRLELVPLLTIKVCWT
jgi:hypothetical protein